MFEQTFYNLLNSILEMEDDKTQDFLDNYNDFLESLLYNQELINETKRQIVVLNYENTLQYYTEDPSILNLQICQEYHLII